MRATDTGSIEEALERGLRMPWDERSRRSAMLRTTVDFTTAGRWFQEFVLELERRRPGGAPTVFRW